MLGKDRAACAGHLGYALAPLVARGLMCGPRTPIFLHMHDAAPAEQVLAAVEMEIMDLASQLLMGAPALLPARMPAPPLAGPSAQLHARLLSSLHACAAPHQLHG